MKGPGAIVNLNPYDSDDVVEAGDVIETTTGRRYLVERAAVVRRRARERERWRYRWRLLCVVMGPDDRVPDGATVHSLVWNRRDRVG